MTADLTTRITEALDQAERLANGAIDVADGDWKADTGWDPWQVQASDGYVISTGIAEEVTLFVAAFNPLAALRSVAADRKLLALYAEAAAYYDAHKSAPAGEVHGLWRAVQLMADRLGVTRKDSTDE